MPDPTPVAAEPRVPSPHHYHQEPVHHHRRSPVQRHSPYGYRVQSHQSPAVEQRVPPMHGHAIPQNNLVVVIPADSSYPTTCTVSPTSSTKSSDLYPTPPQSPVEDLYETPVHQYYSSSAIKASVPQQARLPSTYAAVQMQVPVQRPIQVQEPVWRPW
uniref:HesC n=1 Tax=Amphiura filiformis TaxID=82378 RepID=A0A0E3N2K0_9ECHI|nr:HesC [Amphiura filiformis]